MTLFAFFTPGPLELVIIAAIVLLLFGSRVPQVMRSLGSGITQFKKGLKEVEDFPNEIEREIRETGGRKGDSSQKA